ncbi:MAG: hypothetical protein M1831_000264 [Alyxoria varia]|nr:MAG: hypothetical protein M1831_000264 [Alyxoria varia]
MARDQILNLSNGLKTMMGNPTYADLTFKCEGHEIPAHRVVVCARSLVLDAQCRGPWKEAQTRTIEVTIANLETLMRMLSFLYTDDYDDESELLKDDNSISSDDSSCGSSTEPDFAASTTEKTANVRHDPNTNVILKNNLQVFIIADYYNIPALMNLAVKRFRRNARHFFETDGYADVVAMLYDEVPSHAKLLRDTSDGEEPTSPAPADEVEVPAEEGGGSGAKGQMSVLDALKGVLKLALIHDGLARGVREASKALDRRQAHMCVLNEACEEEAYKKLVVALCGEHQIPLIKVPDGKQLGEWAGLCQIDREGNARKVVNCSCVVVRDWGEESQERNVLLNYFKTEQ